MKLNQMVKKYSLLGLLLAIGVCTSASSFASDINIAQKPLATETEGVAPNIMLIFDDSGSMSCGSGGSCADDVFYAPGYDANKEYRCVNNPNIIKPLAGNVVTVHVSTSGETKGTPYFKFGSDYYAWGSNDKTSIDGNAITQSVCFEPEEKYEVKLHAYTENIGECAVNWTWKEGKNNKSGPSCPASAKCSCSNNNYRVQPHLYSTRATETMDGNFLNWYFSDTIAEWADDSVTGGFKDYGNSGNNHGYWTENAATNFITDLKATFSSNKSGDIEPEKTKLNGSEKNDNNKTWFPPLPVYTSGSYTNQKSAWETTLHNVYDTSGSHNHSTNPAINFTGLKPGVSYNQMRVQVSIDVGKQVIRNLDNAYVALADFHATVDNNYQLSQPSYKSSSRHLLHGFVKLDSEGSPAATQTNKDTLIKVINATGAGGGTPTATTLQAAARYIFTGWDEKITINGKSNKKFSEIFTQEFRNKSSETVRGNSSPTKKHITEENWCQKHAVAILTDGQPSGEASLSSVISDYKPSAVDSVKNVAQKELIRVAGALYDHDFIPSLQGIQNIETFVIAMGGPSVLNDENFNDVGLAGGGGVNNFYKGSDGAAIAQAFKDIIARISASAASITAIAVSAVSEMRADSYAVQATYQTDYWTSQLKAFRLNKKGQFINPNADPDGPGSDSSSGITPIWEAGDKLNQQYIIGDESKRKNVKNRKVFTWDAEKAEGVRFGSDNMTRPSSSNASFAEFNNLPNAMKLDLQKRAGANTQEQYDLMMYLLGDVSNEEGLIYSGCASNNCLEKYRRRGVYTVNTSKEITNVSKGGFLGDIVDSSPVYVKEPPRPWDDKNFGDEENRYKHYKNQLKDRTAMVYVGSNRGFLHAFAVEGDNAGKEVFAYMPNALTSIKANEGYHYLASKNYEHRFYVDLTPTVSDVYMDFYGTNDANPEWRTILIGGLRGGGKGYFALDVTCPFKMTGSESTCSDESFNEKNVLWEFTSNDDEDLGYTFAEPIIAKVFYDTGESDDGRNANGKGRWAAIVSNGYNSLNGRAALFVLFLDGGRDGVWTEGKDYIKLYAGSDENDKPTNKNGLSSATAIDLDGDGIIDQVYAGDVKGQMWSFDIRQSVVFEEANP